MFNYGILDVVEVRVTNLKHFFDPDFLVIIFGTLCRGQRKLEVPVTKKDMVGEHEKQPSWHQDSIQVLFLELPTHFSGTVFPRKVENA